MNVKRFYKSDPKEGKSFVWLWSIWTQESPVELAIGSDELVTFIKWSTSMSVLALGTNKGNLVFYNKKQQKKKNTALKHSDTVIGGEWNKEGIKFSRCGHKVFRLLGHYCRRQNSHG